MSLLLHTFNCNEKYKIIVAMAGASLNLLFGLVLMDIKQFMKKRRGVYIKWCLITSKSTSYSAHRNDDYREHRSRIGVFDWLAIHLKYTKETPKRLFTLAHHGNSFGF
jgi:hypothetical protein